MASPRKMATRENGKLAKNSEIARSFWVKSDRFWRNLFKFYQNRRNLFLSILSIFRVLTKATAIYFLTTFYLFYLIRVQRHTTLVWVSIVGTRAT